MDIIVGTAGHIDHGKTALVKALTGIDADRLPEEKQRGITIDLGFAELKLDDVHFGFVDVPGHERFVKNMLAGAGGIDLVLLVIAADEGVMPQTREHFEICRLLETRSGLIVLTKKDLVDDELLELVKLDVAELVGDSFLESAPVIAVSSKTGEGIDELKLELLEQARMFPARKDDLVMRLPIDRSFTVKGFGPVVTGTLVSGQISETDEVEVLPIGKAVRVRGLQTHGKVANTAYSGQRVAVNLGGIDHTRLARGMALTERNVLRPTRMIDAKIEVLGDAKRPLRSRQRVRVHIGTTEMLARIQVLSDSGEVEQGRLDFVQLRLEGLILAVPGERFILRSYSPQITIAGGKTLDAHPAKHRHKDISIVRDFLDAIAASENDHAGLVRLYVESAGQNGISFAALQARTAFQKELLQYAISYGVNHGSVVEIENYYLSSEAFSEMRKAVMDAVESFHKRDPLAQGMAREILRETAFRYLPPETFRFVLAYLEKAGKIIAERETVRVAAHNVELFGDEAAFREKLMSIYRIASVEVPKMQDALAQACEDVRILPPQARKIFHMLVNSGELLKVTDEFYFSKRAVDDLVKRLREFSAASADRLIDVPKFKEIAGISRKYAIPLLEYFDREKITHRAGDKRIIL